VVIAGPASGNGLVTRPATVSGNGTGGFIGNIAKGGATYAVSVTTPIVFGSVTPSTLNGGNGNAISGTAVIDYGNTACGALTVTFAGDGSGFTMSCATAPSTTQTVLWNSADWQTAQSSANQ